MEEVVAVGWVVVCCPLFRLWAPERELVTAVFGLIVHAVKAGNLNIHKRKRVLMFHWGKKKMTEAGMSVKCFCALTILPTQLFNPTLNPLKKYNKYNILHI